MDLTEATFEGGPYDGRVVPSGTVPWNLFIPRDLCRPGEANRPLRNIPLNEVLTQNHYTYAGVRLGKKLYVWSGRH